MSYSVAFGGGINSTALMVGAVERGEPAPLCITFADTGGEMPGTYEHIARMSDWLVRHGYPAVTVVSAAGRDASLEAECLRKQQLPSIAFGMHGCARDWKVRPQMNYLKSIGAFSGGVHTRWLGIAADEAHRAREDSDTRVANRWPLIEWEWGRRECIEACKRAGMWPVGKSACFFCPARKKSEILALPAELLDRAIAIEDGFMGSGKAGTVVGLGRRFSWRTLREADAIQGKLFPDPPEISCACFADGEGAG